MRKLLALLALLTSTAALAQTTTVPPPLLTPPSAIGMIYNSAGSPIGWTETATPTLGASGALGSISFGNATSGLATIRPATGALGTTIVQIPALGATDTLATLSAAQTLASKTLTSPTINGGTLSGTLAGSFILSGVPTFSGLSSGTCANGLALNASNVLVTATCSGSSVLSVGNAIGDASITYGGSGGGPYTGAVTAKLNLGNSNSWTGDQLFGSGRPWCDVRAQGAKGDGVTDDTAAFNACLAIIRSFGDGGTIYVPTTSGRYCLFSGLTFLSTDYVILRGESSAVDLHTCNHDVTLITASGNGLQIKNFTLFGIGGIPSDSPSSITHPVISLVNCGNECLLQDLDIYGGTRSISIGCGTPDFRLEHIFATNSYGNAIIYEGCASAPIGGWWNRVQADQTSGTYGSYGTIAGTAPAAWASSHSYTVNTVVSSNGYYFQTSSTSCTSGSTAPTLHTYNTSFSDGGCTWLLLAPATYYAVFFDTYSNQNFLHWMDIDGPYTSSMYFDNSLGGAAPTLTTVTDSNAGAVYGYVVDLEYGNGFTLANSTFGASLTANYAIVYYGSNWNGDSQLTGNWFHDASYGVDAAYPVNHANLGVINNNFTNISAVAMTSTVEDARFIGNGCAASNTYTGTTATCWTITGPYYTIIGNDYHGTTNAPIPTNGASVCAAGATTCVMGNIGQ